MNKRKIKEKKSIDVQTHLENLHKEFEKQREESDNAKKFLQSVLDGIQDWIRIVDRNFKVVYTNKSAREGSFDLLKIAKSPSELSSCFTALTQIRTAPCEGCPSVRCFESGNVEAQIYEVQDVNGEKKVYEFSAFPIMDEKKSVRQVIEIIKDITEKKKMEYKLDQAMRLAVIGEISASVAHEIRNPLASIITALDLLLKGVSREDILTMETLIYGLRKETVRLNEILDNFLKYAKPRPVELTLNNINKIVDEVLNVFKFDTIFTAKIKIDTNYDENVKEFYFDRDHIRQVIWNIVLNAFDAMKNGGKLTVSTKLLEDKVILKISDTGKGIKKENLERIFDPFYSDKPGGTGLGLTVSKGIIEAHSGKITVESELDKGSSFIIELPYLKKK